MVGIVPARPGCKARLERQQQDHIGEKRVELRHGASSYEDQTPAGRLHQTSIFSASDNLRLWE